MPAQTLKSTQKPTNRLVVGLLVFTLMLAWWGHDLLGHGYHEVLGQASYDTGGWLDHGPSLHIAAVPAVSFEFQAPLQAGSIRYDINWCQETPAHQTVYRRHVLRPPPVCA